MALTSSPQGEVTSPRHPESYDHNLVCEWVVRLPPEDRVSIRSGWPTSSCQEK